MTSSSGVTLRHCQASPQAHRPVGYGADGWEIPLLLAERDSAEDLYFDSICQIVMDHWTSGRVALIGDAGYSPGPAVRGGTSIAMVGAYVLPQELGQGDRELQAGLRA